MKLHTLFKTQAPKNHTLQGARKVIFTACHSGKLKLTFTSPNIISTSPKNVLMSRLISQFFCNLNSSKKFTCPSGKLITEFTSAIAKSASPGLSDSTFFARCPVEWHIPVETERDRGFFFITLGPTKLGVEVAKCVLLQKQKFVPYPFIVVHDLLCLFLLSLIWQALTGK